MAQTSTPIPLSEPALFSRRAVFLAVFGLVLVVGFPRASGDLLAFGAVLVWAGLAGLLILELLRRTLVLTATVSASFVLAYSQGLGDALAEGTALDRIAASPGGVADALLVLVFFLAGTALVATWVRRLAGAQVRSDSAAVANDPWPMTVAIVVFLGMTLLAALATGFWTYWGGMRGGEADAGGSIRLELSYPSALLLVVGHFALLRIDGLSVGPRRHPWIYGTLAVLLGLLFFALQSRRLMVASGLLIGFSWLLGQAPVPKVGPRPRSRLILRFAGLAAVLGVFGLASSGWREVREGEEVGLGDRIERAVSSISDTSGSLQGLEARLTYLWFDAMTQDLHARFGAELDGDAMLASATARAVPRLLMPNKDEVPNISCEAGLEGFGLPEDLPCTPTSEGLLIGGLWGVLLAILCWGVGLGIAEACVARGPGLARAFGLILLFPFIMLEEGVFAIIPALRGGLIGLGLLAVTLFLYQFLASARQGAPARARLPPD